LAVNLGAEAADGAGFLFFAGFVLFAGFLRAGFADLLVFTRRFDFCPPLLAAPAFLTLPTTTPRLW
jgi:hypothetical protein